mgnify:CR=1 FL=1
MSDKNNANVAADKLDFKRVLPIFVIVLVDLLGLTIIIPLLPFYAASFQANARMIGILGATYPLMQLVGAPLLGRISDRVGRKPVLIASQIGTLVGFLVLGFANSLWLLFLSRIIDGLSGGNISTAQAAISDSTTEKTRTQGLGLVGAAFGLGFTIGPVLAFVALAASGNNYQIPAFLAAGCALISIALTVFWFEETLPEEKRGLLEARTTFSVAALLKALTNPAVGLLLVLLFVGQLAFNGFEQILSLFTLSRLGMNAASNAGLFVFIGVLAVIIQGGMIGLLSRRFGDRRLVFGGLAALGVGLLLTAVTPMQTVPWYSEAAMRVELAGAAGAGTEQALTVDLPGDGNAGWLGLGWLVVAMIPASFGSVLQPAINSLITKRVTVAEIGGYLGIATAFTSAANVSAPLIAGDVFERAGPSAPFWLFGGLLIVALVVAVIGVRKGAEERGALEMVREGQVAK